MERLFPLNLLDKCVEFKIFRKAVTGTREEKLQVLIVRKARSEWVAGTQEVSPEDSGHNGATEMSVKFRVEGHGDSLPVLRGEGGIFDAELVRVGTPLP